MPEGVFSPEINDWLKKKFTKFHPLQGPKATTRQGLLFVYRVLLSKLVAHTATHLLLGRQVSERKIPGQVPNGI